MATGVVKGAHSPISRGLLNRRRGLAHPLRHRAPHLLNQVGEGRPCVPDALDRTGWRVGQGAAEQAPRPRPGSAGAAPQAYHQRHKCRRIQLTIPTNPIPRRTTPPAPHGACPPQAAKAPPKVASATSPSQDRDARGGTGEPFAKGSPPPFLGTWFEAGQVRVSGPALSDPAAGGKRGPASLVSAGRTH